MMVAVVQEIEYNARGERWRKIVRIAEVTVFWS